MKHHPDFHPSRRRLLKSLGAAAALAGFQAGVHQPLWGQAACTVLGSPSLTEGPYFADEDLNRSDIRIDPSDGSMQPGLPLALSINVAKLVNCVTAPLAGAYVDVWHCNAAGVYSDMSAQNSTGKKYLRGYQPTDRHGNVYFTTIYPGWYQGRAVHIHAKIRTFDGESRTYEFTSQFFFDDSFSDDVYRTGVYAGNRVRDTRNTNDGIYSGASSTGTITRDSGSYLMLVLRNKGTYVEADAKLICDISLGSTPGNVPGGPGGPGGGPGGPGGPGGGA